MPTIYHFDGFDHYATADILSMFDAASGAAISTAQKRTGAQSLFIWANTNYADKVLSAGVTTICAGAWVYFDQAGYGDAALIRFYEGTTLHVDLRFLTAGAVSVTRNGTTLGTSANAVYPLKVGFHVQFKAVISDTVGTYEVKINGVTVLSGTGADTRNGGTGVVDTIRLRPAGGANYNTYVDDYWIADDFLGDARVDTLLPDSAGDTQDFTCSSGSDHDALVDETTPDGDTTYVYSSTAGHIDLFGMQDTSVTGTILAIMQLASVRKDDAGTRTVRTVCRLSGTNYTGATVSIGSTYTYIKDVRQLNPSTGLGWSTVGVNALQHGLEVVS